MEKLVGIDKPLNQQIEIIKEILFQNENLVKILTILEKSNIKNYYVAAGIINQTVFNYYHGYNIDANIDDIDICYFDEDTSYESEDKIIKELLEKLPKNYKTYDIKNEARVHIWYEKKYGIKKEAYTSIENAINSWTSTVTCIGVRLEQNKLIVYAPFGLNDLFNQKIVPNKSFIDKEKYKDKCQKWKKKWPNLQIIEYR